jgi:citronellyl-CoA dehydrogenase
MTTQQDKTPEHRAFRETVRAFVRNELAPRAREFDKMGRLDKSLFPKMGELGMLGLRYDEAYGGSGLDWTYTAILCEELGRADNVGVMTGISVHTDMATPSLHRFGSEELKQKYLVPAIRGEVVSAIAVTEPDAGSDVANIRTRAVRDGDDWVINGSKMETPGVSYDLLDKIGFWGSDTGQIFFEDVRVPVSNTIGQIGAGFMQQMMQFQSERLVATIGLVAYCEELWDVTCEWARDRKLFGRTLMSMQNTQFKLVECKTLLTTARLLNQACVDALVDGEDATELISMAKLHTGRVVRQVADTCFQLHGGMGYMKESMAGRAYCDMRIASVGGGSDETMMHYLAKRWQL